MCLYTANVARFTDMTRLRYEVAQFMDFKQFDTVPRTRTQSSAPKRLFCSRHKYICRFLYAAKFDWKSWLMCFFFDTCSGLFVSKSEFQQFKIHSKQLIPSVSADVHPGVVQHSKFRAPIPTSGKYFWFSFQHDILPSYGQLCSRYDTVQDDLACICDGMAAICVCTAKRVWISV